MTDNLSDRVSAIKELLEVFRFERIVYLTINIVSFIVLISSAILLLLKNTDSPIEVLGLFGSSGGITYSTGRLLRMWSEALKILSPISKGNDA